VTDTPLAVAGETTQMDDQPTNNTPSEAVGGLSLPSQAPAGAPKLEKNQSFIRARRVSLELHGVKSPSNKDAPKLSPTHSPSHSAGPSPSHSPGRNPNPSPSRARGRTPSPGPKQRRRVAKGTGTSDDDVEAIVFQIRSMKNAEARIDALRKSMPELSRDKVTPEQCANILDAFRFDHERRDAATMLFAALNVRDDQAVSEAFAFISDVGERIKFGEELQARLKKRRAASKTSPSQKEDEDGKQNKASPKAQDKALANAVAAALDDDSASDSG